MFEVVRYAHPEIFVTCRRTGDTYKFQIREDGTLAHDGTSFDQGEARRIAIAYLFHKRRLQLKPVLH
jgi:hypothetical protein